MSTILAVDPGLRGCGVAVFHDGRLERAAYLPGEKTGRGGPAWLTMARNVERWFDAAGTSYAWSATPYLVVECPQVYTFGKSKGDPGDLIELAGVGGALFGRFPVSPGFSPLPREWKGQVPKEIHHARILSALTSEEFDRLSRDLAPVATRLQHNVLDAVGLGLWAACKVKERARR